MTFPPQVEPNPEQAAQALLACITEMARITQLLTPPLSGPNHGGRGVENLHGLAEIVAKLTDLASDLQDMREARPVGTQPTRHAADGSEVGARCAGLLMQNLDSEPRQPEIQDGCVLRGVSPAVPISALFQYLSSHRATGTVRVVTTAETFTLEVADGHIAHAVSDRTPPNARLGTILLARGAIELPKLHRFLEQYSSSSELMGEALGREELVDKTQLQAALEEQVQKLFNRLFAQQEATFSFYEGNPSHPQIHIRMNVIQLLLESARTMDEQNWAEGG